jgi:16S rRNA (uracil1498-N3)-methyltransferase
VTTTPVFLVDVLPEGADAVLGGAEGHHAATVRRLRPGEAVRLSDGAGGIADCTVTAAGPDGLRLAVVATRRIERPPLRFVLVQALAKGDRGELAVELATELGVDEIVPWAAARSVTRWEGPRGEKALARWRSTAREAAKQSRRAWIPRVTEPVTTKQLAAREAAATLVLHEAADQRLTEADLPDEGEVLVVVGPEGGIDDTELATLGGTPVRLGDPVLRTSTAGAAALAVLSVRTGRWS